MSIRLAAFRLFKNGRYFIRSIHRIQQGKIASHKNIGDGSAPNLRWTVGRPSLVQHVTSQARRVVVDAVLNRVTHTFHSELRRKVTRRLLFGDSTPFFALVGVSLASGAGILTKDDELEAVCWEIRDAVSRLVVQRLQGRDLKSEEMPEIELSSLELGPPLAKGCNAVIYAARWKDEFGANDDSSSSDPTKPPSLLEYPLAVKMMFNYDAESNAISVLQAMHQETVPAWFRHRDVTQVLGVWEEERTISLPPHSNIVEMYRVFTAPVPNLAGSMNLYPDALPRRLNPDGYGRNMSLFMVMKRYECSLQKLLQKERPSYRVSHLLLAQLLEAVAHMGRNKVAHRDLKSDNLLLDWSGGDEVNQCPILAVCDFGCCLADVQHGMILPFHSFHTSRGGNAAHMPPEVACAVPGSFTSINYSKADLWAAGAIAYEIFGLSNPFSGEHRLSNSSYREDQLPMLPEEVPAPLRALIHAMLCRNPAKRPSPELAASVCQLLLWAPSEWLQGSPPRNPSSSEILQWLLSLATKVLCESGFLGRGRRTLPEYQLISSLLARTSLQQMRQAVAFVHYHLL